MVWRLKLIPAKSYSSKTVHNVLWHNITYLKCITSQVMTLLQESSVKNWFDFPNMGYTATCFLVNWMNRVTNNDSLNFLIDLKWACHTIYLTLSRALLGYVHGAQNWGGERLFIAPLLSLKPLGRFSQFKRRLIALSNLSSVTWLYLPRGHQWRHRSGKKTIAIWNFFTRWLRATAI